MSWTTFYRNSPFVKSTPGPLLQHTHHLHKHYPSVSLHIKALLSPSFLQNTTNGGFGHLVTPHFTFPLTPCPAMSPTFTFPFLPPQAPRLCPITFIWAQGTFYHLVIPLFTFSPAPGPVLLHNIPAPLYPPTPLSLSPTEAKHTPFPPSILMLHTPGRHFYSNTPLC